MEPRGEQQGRAAASKQQATRGPEQGLGRWRAGHGKDWKDPTSLTEWQASTQLIKQSSRGHAGTVLEPTDQNVPLNLYQCPQVADIRVMPSSVQAGRTARVKCGSGTQNPRPWPTTERLHSSHSNQHVPLVSSTEPHGVSLHTGSKAPQVPKALTTRLG